MRSAPVRLAPSKQASRKLAPRKLACASWLPRNEAPFVSAPSKSICESWRPAKFAPFRSAPRKFAFWAIACDISCPDQFKGGVQLAPGVGVGRGVGDAVVVAAVWPLLWCDSFSQATPTNTVSDAIIAAAKEIASQRSRSSVKMPAKNTSAASATPPTSRAPTAPNNAAAAPASPSAAPGHSHRDAGRHAVPDCCGACVPPEACPDSVRSATFGTS